MNSVYASRSRSFDANGTAACTPHSENGPGVCFPSDGCVGPERTDSRGRVVSHVVPVFETAVLGRSRAAGSPTCSSCSRSLLLCHVLLTAVLSLLLLLRMCRPRGYFDMFLQSSAVYVLPVSDRFKGGLLLRALTLFPSHYLYSSHKNPRSVGSSCSL